MEHTDQPLVEQAPDEAVVAALAQSGGDSVEFVESNQSDGD